MTQTKLQCAIQPNIKRCQPKSVRQPAASNDRTHDSAMPQRKEMPIGLSASTFPHYNPNAGFA
jgi:hypothetical protein